MMRVSGAVVSPLFLCLKEEYGRLSYRIKENLFNADNIVLSFSISGKQNRSLVEYRRDQVPIRLVGNGQDLLLSYCS